MRYWTEHKLTTMNLSNKKNLEELAGMPPATYDTIKIVTNRITMLQRLAAEVESLDPELFELMCATEGKNPLISTAVTGEIVNGKPRAVEAAALLEIQPIAARLSVTKTVSDPALTDERLWLIRKVLTAAMEVRTAIDVLDDEICYESDVMGRMTRSRDNIIALTNNLNFYQLNILTMVINGPLSMTGNPHRLHASNIVNIVSSLTVGGLALATVLEQRGGWRPLPAHPNMLGQCLGMSPPGVYRFSMSLWKFINAVPSWDKNGQTRVQKLQAVWKQLPGTYPDMEKQKNRERLAAYGPSYKSKWETIQLIQKRINMLYDLQGLVGLFDSDLDDLLNSIN